MNIDTIIAVVFGTAGVAIAVWYYGGLFLIMRDADRDEKS